MYQTVFLVFVTLLLKINSCSCANPIVDLPNGTIQGKESITFANTTYYSFQKIPYAAPPVGDLRFKAPQPAQNWDGILNATVDGGTCLQLQYVIPAPQSEDCLFVNVFTPQLPSDSNTTLPVMLFIHGGAFVGVSFPALPDLFVDNGVILVSINYRLGLFGFLSTQDEIIPGNNALKDQRLAIQWTHENIHLFGGDPDKITVFGQSAGSASVGYQILNQESEGLFRAAIMESGVSICPWTIQRRARSIAFAVAALLNSTFATSDDSRDLLRFLQSVEAETLNAAAAQYMDEVGNPWDYDVSQGVLFGPVIEVENADAFITEKMYGLVQAGSFLKIPMIVGINSEENLVFNDDPVILQSSLEAWDQDLDLIVPDDMQIEDPDKHAEMSISIRDIYTNGEPFGDNLGAGIRYSSDNSFSRPVIKFAELLSKHTETYFYQFSYDGELGGLDIHYDGAESVGHSEELIYLFCSGSVCDDSTYPESDQITRRRLINMWTNFAKYLNPTPGPSDLLQNITWPQLDTNDGDFLYLDINENLEVRNHPKNETYWKWINLYESLIISDFDTF